MHSQRTQPTFVQAEEYYGATRTRAIFERAIEALPDDKVGTFRDRVPVARNGNANSTCRTNQLFSSAQLKDISLKFAEMERKLGEIDRARAIFMYASQFCDPRVVVSLWREWHKFEVQHGNEETFREMLRVKRSVQVILPDFYWLRTPTVCASSQPGSVQPDQLHGSGNAHCHTGCPV